MAEIAEQRLVMSEQRAAGRGGGEVDPTTHCGCGAFVPDFERQADGLCVVCRATRPPMPRIPRRFENERLDTYIADTPSQVKALEAVRHWCEHLDQGPMLALIGPQGTGKSHLLYAAAWEIYHRHQVTAYCRSWIQLGNQLRYGTPGDFPTEPHAVRSELHRAPVVLIDELRPISGTDFDPTELAAFACQAYDEMTPVLITTNVDPLAEILGGPAADRFTECVIVAPSERGRA